MANCEKWSRDPLSHFGKVLALLRRLGIVLVSAVPYALLAACFLESWLHPLKHPGAVKFLSILLITEVWAIGATGVMGCVAVSELQRAEKLKVVLGFAAILGGAFAIVGASFNSWAPVQAFLLLTFAKLWDILMTGMPTKADRKRFIIRFWVWFYAYGGVAWLMAFLPVPIPEFGITPDVARQVHLDCGGIIGDEPHKAMAWGFVCFTIMAGYSLVEGLADEVR